VNVPDAQPGIVDINAPSTDAKAHLPERHAVSILPVVNTDAYKATRRAACDQFNTRLNNDSPSLGLESLHVYHVAESGR